MNDSAQEPCIIGVLYSLRIAGNMVIGIAKTTTHQTLAAWNALKADLPLPKKMRDAIEKRLLTTAKQFLE